MGDSEMASSVAARPAVWTGRLRFFSAMPIVLLAIVLVGFGPTFYLVPLNDAAPPPPTLVVHGIIMTAWFALFAVQSALGVHGRLATHRKLGQVALGVAVAMVVSGVFVVLEQVPRAVGASADVEAALDRVSPLFWSGVTMLVAFTTLTTTAVVFVRRTDVHRRLMLLASIILVPPAAARIFGPGQPLTAATLLLLLAALFAYDTWRLGRPQTVTWLGGLGIVVWSFTMLGGVAQSSFGRAVVLALS